VAVRQIRQSRFKAAVKNNRSVPSSFEYPFRVQKKQAKPEAQEKPPAEEVKPDKRKDRQEDRQPDKQSDKQSNKQEDSQPNRPLKEKTKK
jgi:hypothetical protein